MGLSCRGGMLEFVAEVLKVFLADLQLQYFFDHRREVRQRADRSQRRSAGGPYEPPRRSQHEGVLNRFQRHAALVQLGRQSPGPDGGRRRTCPESHGRRPEAGAHSRCCLHRAQPCGSRNDGPLMVTVWQ